MIEDGTLPSLCRFFGVFGSLSLQEKETIVR